MNIVNKFWQNFKAQPDVWFFYGFLISFTLSIHKVLFFYLINGQFNEYAGIHLYLSDILLFLALASWGYSILYNNKFGLSSLSPTNVPRGTIIIPVLILLWSFLSLIWADNKNLALFRSFKLAEFYLLYLYIAHNVPRGTFLKNTLRIIIATSIIQSILGIWQFAIQHSIGLIWLRESLIGADIPGVAKVIFDGHKVVRAYGLFPHPNILGGFLLISILATYIYTRLFHACPVGCSTWNIPTGVEQSNLSLKKAGLKTWIFLIPQILALILTFSKSAILGFLIAIGYVLYINVPHGTNILARLKIMFHVEHFTRKAMLALGIILTLALIVRPDTNSLLFKSLNERLFYLNVSRGTILAHPIIGIGSGQFVLEVDKFVPYGTNIESWQHQPVHNVFLLIWSELGIIGFGLLSWWLWKLFHPRRNEIVPCGTISSYGASVEQNITAPSVKYSMWNNGCEVYEPVKQNNVPRGTFLTQHKILIIFKGALLSLIFIMLFDHYFWDIQQGQILLWLVAGLVVGIAQQGSVDKS